MSINTCFLRSYFSFQNPFSSCCGVRTLYECLNKPKEKCSGTLFRNDKEMNSFFRHVHSEDPLYNDGAVYTDDLIFFIY